MKTQKKWKSDKDLKQTFRRDPNFWDKKDAYKVSLNYHLQLSSSAWESSSRIALNQTSSASAAQAGESRSWPGWAPGAGSSPTTAGMAFSTGKQPVQKTAPNQSGPPTWARPNEELVGFGLPLNPASYLILGSNTAAPNSTLLLLRSSLRSSSPIKKKTTRVGF